MIGGGGDIWKVSHYKQVRRTAQASSTTGNNPANVMPALNIGLDLSLRCGVGCQTFITDEA